ncbi:MAG: hypothetical protein C4576_07195 [Desulfobacteraceae bacterium]|nr:MAG: hypothetical protein C4576_07195 [Desulfobacteraceae bacterium]
MSRRTGDGRIRIVVLAFFLIVGLVSMKDAHADSMDLLRSSLPSVVGDFKADGEDRIFDEKSIFDYIDGAGEVYRAYNFRRCFARRYADERGSAVILDIFDMGSSGDAYGVFTHDLDGDPIEVGQDGLYRSGWLRFWKGSFFVSVFDESQSASSKQATAELARTVAGQIREEGRKPHLVSLLPSSGLQTGSIRYLHDQVVLNTHFYISEENILHLEPRAEAVLAGYRRDGGSAMLLLAAYPSEGKAREALQDVLKHYLPDGGKEGIARLENGKWSAVASVGRFVAFVPEAENRDLSKALVSEALASVSRVRMGSEKDILI